VEKIPFGERNVKITGEKRGAPMLQGEKPAKIGEFKQNPHQKKEMSNFLRGETSLQVRRENDRQYLKEKSNVHGKQDQAKRQKSRRKRRGATKKARPTGRRYR